MREHKTVRAFLALNRNVFDCRRNLRIFDKINFATRGKIYKKIACFDISFTILAFESMDWV